MSGELENKDFFTTKRIVILLVATVAIALLLNYVSTTIAAVVIGCAAVYVPLFIKQFEKERKARKKLAELAITELKAGSTNIDINNIEPFIEPNAVDQERQLVKPTKWALVGLFFMYVAVNGLVILTINYLGQKYQVYFPIESGNPHEILYENYQTGITFLIATILGNFVGGYLLGKNLNKVANPLYYPALIAFVFKLVDSIGLQILTPQAEYRFFLISIAGSIVNVLIAIGGTWIALVKFNQLKPYRKLGYISLISFMSLSLICYFIFLKYENENSYSYFNTFQTDLPIILASNHTVNLEKQTNNFPDWQPFIKAKYGDVICFRIYYHNTSEYLAKNTKIHLNVSVYGNNIIGSASLSSDNSSEVIIGSALVELDSSWSVLAEFGSTVWYPFQTTYPVPLPNKQEGHEILYVGGISIGDVYPSKNSNNSFETSGSLVISFTLSSNTEELSKVKEPSATKRK